MSANTKSRGFWGSRLGFILAASGSAVGLGNIWKFPYITGENGGGAFVLVYLVCVFLIGLPIMLAEFSLGRKARLNPVGAFNAIKPKSPWVGIGFMGVFAGFLVLSFYGVVGGWSIAYTVKSIALSVVDFSNPSEAGNFFAEFVSNPPHPANRRAEPRFPRPADCVLKHTHGFVRIYHLLCLACDRGADFRNFPA